MSSEDHLKHGEWEGELISTNKFVKLSVTWDKKPYCLIEFRRKDDDLNTWEIERKNACLRIWNLYIS